MKKILALLLALCMALAALPVLAETAAATDVSGTWYLLMFGLTGITFELNPDGTCVMTNYIEEGLDSIETTWTATEDSVILAAGEESLSLSYDGTSLLLDENALMLVGAEAGDLGGTDISMIASILQFSREPGITTFAEFSAYMDDGVLPEGKTEEDMQAVYAQYLMAMLTLLSSMDSSGSSGDTADTDEPAVPEDASATIVDHNCYVRDSYSGKVAFCIIKVQNETEYPLYINNGSLNVTDAEGNSIAEDTYFDTVGSRYLDPGEITFITFTAKLGEDVTPDGYEFEIESGPKGYYSKDRAVEVNGTDLELDLENEYNYYNYAWATVTNTGDEPLMEVSILYAVKDAEGKLLDISTNTLYSIEIEPGSTIRVRNSIDSYVIAYCKENGITPAQVEAYASVSAE